MKRPIFKVHGPPEKRRYFYGSLITILGALLSVFGAYFMKLISLSLICIGLWTCWHAFRLGDALTLPKWMRPFLFYSSVVVTIGLIVLVIGYLLGVAGIIDF